MRKIKRLIKSFYQLFLPVIVLVFIAAVAAAVWLVYVSSIPPRSEHLVTPEKYARLSSRGAQVTNESWSNKDGTQARGWLLRGAPGSPAVLLLHRYGVDRSHLLNLGVKLNEATNFTVLMPDFRGHGLNPPIEQTTHGGCEAEDIAAAIEFLNNVSATEGGRLVGKDLGVFGIELGSLAGLSVVANNPNIKAAALESVPRSSDHLLGAIVAERFPFAGFLTSRLVRVGTYPYYITGCYNRASSCDMAAKIENREIMLLAGPDTPYFQTSTSNLSSCFSQGNRVKAFTDLAPTGYDLTGATLEQADFYDQRIIYFFKEALSN